MNFVRANELIAKVEQSLTTTQDFRRNKDLLVGVDLGTAYIVLIVLDKEKNPVAAEMQFAQVLKDGLVVDYIGACRIVRALKAKLEERLNTVLEKAAIAVPPGTDERDCRTHQYVVEGAGLEVTAVLDEPTAANAVLGITKGVIVDIGGGTTGLSIFNEGEVVYTADEATGGTHLSLVIAGNYGISFEQAEEMKKDVKKQKEIFTVVRPVIQKIASIIKCHIAHYPVEDIYLVGGTCCLQNIEEVISIETGIRTQKPTNPFLVTPLGIAMNCKV